MHCHIQHNDTTYVEANKHMEQKLYMFDSCHQSKQPDRDSDLKPEPQADDPDNIRVKALP